MEIELLEAEDDPLIPMSRIYAELWRRGELSYKLDKLQKQIRAVIYESKSDKYLILSSRQIGKSYLACIIGLEFCIRNPNSIVRIVAPTLKQAHDIAQDNLAAIIQDAPPGLVQRHKSEMRWLVGSSSLRLGAFERSHVDSNRGVNASLIITEEAGFVDSENFKYAMESVLGPQLIRSGGTELHISSPSEDEFHYLHTDILPRCELHGTSFRYTVYDSPSITPKQIDQAAERCGGVETESFRREYMAEIIRSKSLMVIPEYDDSQHVAEFELPRHYYSAVGVDFGGSQDKSAGCIVAYDFKLDRLLVAMDFMCDSNTRSPDIIARARELEVWAQSGYEERLNRVIDAPAQLIGDLLESTGYLATSPLKDDLQAALNMVRVLFQQGKVLIHPRCASLRGCIKAARWNSKRTDFVRTSAFGHADPLMGFVYAVRALNRSLNPYPQFIPKHDDQMRNPTIEHIDKFSEIAEALVPNKPSYVQWR